MDFSIVDISKRHFNRWHFNCTLAAVTRTRWRHMSRFCAPWSAANGQRIFFRKSCLLPESETSWRWRNFAESKASSKSWKNRLVFNQLFYLYPINDRIWKTLHNIRYINFILCILVSLCFHPFYKYLLMTSTWRPLLFLDGAALLKSIQYMNEFKVPEISWL